MHLTRLTLAAAIIGLGSLGATAEDAETKISVRGRSGIVVVAKPAPETTTIALSKGDAGVGKPKVDKSDGPAKYLYHNVSRPVIRMHTTRARGNESGSNE